MMGMSSPEWSSSMARELGGPMEPAAISSETVAQVAARYRRPCSRWTARSRWSRRWPSIGRSAWPALQPADHGSGVGHRRAAGRFRALVSSEEAARGKPAPDVYLEAAARLGVPPERCAASRTG
jgi:hypothetical protein